MAETPILRTAETQVNITDAAVGAGGNNTQEDGQIVALGDGGYVVVWTDGSLAFNPGGTAVLGQRYDVVGNRVGGEFNISQFVVGDQSAPAVTPLPDGGFAVAFVDSANNGDIYVRLYDVDLNLVRTDTIDMSAATMAQPSITAFADGSYVVAYTVGASNTDVEGRHVSAAGVVGSPFSIHADPNSTDSVELATLSNGNFVAAVRDDDDLHPQEDSVRFRVFQPDGTPVTGSVLFEGVREASHPDVAALRDGGFVFAYRDDDDFSDSDAAVVTVWDNDANGMGSFDIEGSNNNPRVVALTDGGFVVTWEPFVSDELRGQRFDAAVNPVGSRFVVRDEIPFDADPAADAALLQDGRFAFAITDPSSGDLDVATSIWGATIDVADLAGVLWQHVDGTVATRDTELGSAPPTWQIVGTADFDADDDTDILWRHAEGQVVTWELQDGQLVTSHSISFASLSWSIAETGDFDGDSDADIIWRHDEGAVVTWEMQDGAYVQTNSLPSVSTSWSIDGVGDFDGDGDDDIIWRHDEGTVVTWEMEDGAYVQNHNIAVGSIAWHISGTGDFDGDGDDDILWRHDEGMVTTWEMQDGAYVQNHNLPDVRVTWQISGIADFDHDGDSDIVWRHDEGTVATWEMEDGAFVQSDNLGVVADTWQIRGTGQFDVA